MSDAIKRFFHIDDGAEYWIVATDIDHAAKLMQGVDLDVSKPQIVELSPEGAAKVRCNTSEDNRGRGIIPLTECDLGEWFSAEW